MSEDDASDIRALRETVVDLRLVIASLATTVDTLNKHYAGMDETYVRKENVEPRLKSLELTRTWVANLIIGAVLLAVMGFILTKQGGPLP
jgi:hypothetical protein